MTDFKYGDRVSYNAIDDCAARTHGDRGTVIDDNTPHIIQVRWDGGGVGLHCHEYLTPDQTAFKPGDRVRGGSANSGQSVTGVVAEPLADWEKQLLYGTTRPLVGPAPKVAAPVVQTPFSYDKEDWVIQDAKGRRVLILSLHEEDFGELTEDEFDSIGEWFAAALNARED